MNILVLIDKFKNTLNSTELSKIIKSTFKTHNVDYFPISDGGDGFLSTINYKNEYNKKYCVVKDALGNNKRVYYLLKDDIAYIEVAKIIGFNKNNNLDILNANTYGVGQIILHAIKNKAKKFYIGLGGTITNDGGKGMLEALGYSFNNNFIKPSIIDYNQYSFNVISDVTNPLLGKKGATYVFAKQKGATDMMLPFLEKRLISFSKVINKYLLKDYSRHIGAGAAGGLGFAFISILNAKYHDGIDFILDFLKIDQVIDRYDLLITGEGKVDNQSLNGKIVFKIRNRFKKKTLILCAINETNRSKNIYSIVPNFATVEQSLNNPRYYFKKMCKSLKI